MVRYAAQTRLRYEPGSSNAYSNLGYVVLTKVIEKVSGMPYEKFIQDSILTPIGCYDMHIGHSFYEMRFPKRGARTTSRRTRNRSSSSTAAANSYPGATEDATCKC